MSRTQRTARTRRTLLISAAALSAITSGGVIAGDDAATTAIAPSAGHVMPRDVPAATAKGGLDGVVKARDGHAMPGQQVRLARPTTRTSGPPRTVARVTSDAQGKFAFKDVEPGTYEVVAAREGVGFARLRDVVVNANQTTTVELKFP